MSLETLNLSLFHVINGAQDASQFIIRLAIFLLMISSIFFYSYLLLWFYGDQDLKIGSLNLSFNLCIAFSRLRYFSVLPSPKTVCDGCGHHLY